MIGGFDEAFPVLEDLELFIRLSKRYAFLHLRVLLVRYFETHGLSKNMPAKIVARTLLLRIHQAELARNHPAFLAAEMASLRGARRPAEGATSADAGMG